MRVTDFIRHRSNYPWEAVEQGITVSGDVLVPPSKDMAANAAVVSWNAYGSPALFGKLCQDVGGEWIVMENGYINRQQGWYAMGRSGWAGTETPLPWLKWVTSKRWDSFGIPIPKWKQNGEFVLVCGQMGRNYSPLAMKDSWPTEIVNQLKAVTDRKIVYRPHPIRTVVPAASCKNVVVDTATPLAELLAKAKVTVVWTSNVATDSVLSGTPCVYCGPSVAVKEMIKQGVQGLEEYCAHPFPIQPEVLWQLVWRQFHKDELKSGRAWRIMTGREVPV